MASQTEYWLPAPEVSSETTSSTTSRIGLLGPRRRHQGARSISDTAARRVRVLDLRVPDELPTSADRGIDTSTRSRPTWAAWDSSPRTTPTILRNNALIDIHTLEAARQNGVDAVPLHVVGVRVPGDLQTEPRSRRSARRTRIPPSRRTPTAGRSSSPSSSCQYYTDEFGMATRVVRFHNIYGPYGTYDGGREKAPAAHVPQGRARPTTAGRSRSGATASRRDRSATSTTASRASTG